MLKIAIQGEAASFHDIAAQSFFGKDIHILPCKTFADTFTELQGGNAQYALTAIENSLFGSINEVYDLLLTHKFWIMGEVYERIKQCLIGLPGSTLETIREVHSHPVALMQCEAYLDQFLPLAQRYEHYDTAGSVADIKKWNDPGKAAIASQAAAELHSLPILAAGIETNKQNYTRFVVLAPNKPASLADANKTSLTLVTGHKPGALYHALGAFAGAGINLTKLQSRPIIGQAWHYMFYIDVAVGLELPSMQKALAELESQQCEVTVLGSYASAPASESSA